MKNNLILLYLALSSLFIGCKSKPSFEKDGGMRFTLSISYPDYFASLTENGSSDHVKTVLAGMLDQSAKDFTGFIDSFQKTETKLFPDAKLASNFISPEWNSKININSTNEEINKVLMQELEKAISQTCFMIKKRLDKLDAQNAIIKSDNETIIVEIPGTINSKRIQGLLTTVGKLGLWETYNNTQIFPLP